MNMINAIKNKNGILKMLTVIVGVIAVGVLVYVFGFAYLFDKGKADQALSAGKIEITSARDLDDYFVFLPAERVQALLQKSEGKFLFPQIDLVVADGRSLIIREQKTNIYDQPFNFVTISGLLSGAKIYTTAGMLNKRDTALYSTIDGFIRGGIVPRDDGALHIWAKEAWTEEDDGNIMLTYISAPNIGIINNPALNITIHERAFLLVEQGTHYATLLTETPLPEELVPGGANVAVAIAGADGVFIKLSLQNILTYKGRIVMIERKELITEEAVRDEVINGVAPLTPLVVPPIPTNLIVLDKIWRNAFFLTIDGAPLIGSIGLSHVPVGTELRSPMDGYVYSEEGQVFVDGEKINSLFLTRYQRLTNEQNNKGIMFNVAGAEIINRAPRKGEVFARITNNALIGVGFFDRETRLGIIIKSTDLLSKDDSTTEDPRAYLWTTIQHILPTR